MLVWKSACMLGSHGNGRIHEVKSRGWWQHDKSSLLLERVNIQMFPSWNTYRHTLLKIIYPWIQNNINLVVRAVQCNLVGLQNGFWLQASKRIADPLIRRREYAVNPLSFPRPLQSNKGLSEPVDLHPWTVNLLQLEAQLAQGFQNEVWKSQRPCKSAQEFANQQRSN